MRREGDFKSQLISKNNSWETNMAWLLSICNVKWRVVWFYDEIDGYIFNALLGGILDKKAKKQIESMLIITGAS